MPIKSTWRPVCSLCQIPRLPMVSNTSKDETGRNPDISMRAQGNWRTNFLVILGGLPSN